MIRGVKNHQGGQRVIVAVNPYQKEVHSIDMPDGSQLELYVGSKFSEDGKVSKPTLGRVISDCEDIQAGDMALFAHVVISDDKWLDVKGYTKGNERMYAIDKSSIIFVIRQNEDKKEAELIPVNDNILCERMYFPEEVSPGGIILDLEPKKMEDRVRILKVPYDMEDVKEGDVVLMYKFSDYEVKYVYNNKQQEAIRIKHRDILGIDTKKY